MTVKDFFSMLTYDSLKGHYAKLGYKFYDRGDYNVNVFGFRLTVGTDEFDDMIGIAYREGGEKILKVYKGTTDPGMYWLEHLMNEDGCAIVVPGQYPGSHKVGPHGKHQYSALRQKGMLSIYRDGNLDREHDMSPSTIDTDDDFCINIHHGWNAKKVSRNSAGCQVIQSKKDFKEFMKICYNAKATWGNSFTYTLFDLDSLNL